MTLVAGVKENRMKLFRTTLLPLACWLALLFALAAFPLLPASAAPMRRAVRHSAKYRFRHNPNYRAGYWAGYRAGRSRRPRHLQALHNPPGG